MFCDLKFPQTVVASSENTYVAENLGVQPRITTWDFLTRYVDMPSMVFIRLLKDHIFANPQLSCIGT